MVCLITGSSRGLGRAVALAFGSKGHRVVVHCRTREDEAVQVASRIDESLVLKADVSSADAVRGMVKQVIDTWGRIDVLVNNAGITKEALLVRTPEAEFDEVIRTNLTGAFHCIQSVGEYMMKQKGGHIINISSYAGVKGRKGLSAYAAAKAGLIGLTMTAARELGRYGINVNAVLPGFMLTDMGTDAAEHAREEAFRENILNRFSVPEAVAGFIVSLSDMDGITGQVFNLDGRIM